MHSFATNLESYVEKARSMQLHKTTEWNRSLYIRNGKSLVISKEFFLTESEALSRRSLAKARDDEEMEAHIRALFEPASEEHALCRFPARSKWLIRQLNIPQDHFSKIHCTEYEKFKAMVYPKTVWITFASYYLNTPASSYGHTLLRLSKSSSGDKQNDLLDYSVNLGANVDTENAFAYAIKGLSGGFTGSFAALPYYFKIREYNDYESRDLWSYQLNFNEAQIERLVDLLWELDGTFFRYYYISHNCSFYLLALIEAVDEKIQLLDKVPPYVIPIETVKALFKQPNFVVNVSYRPSSRQQFWAEYDRLSGSEKKIYTDLVDIKRHSMPLLAYDHTTQVHLIDTALAHFDYAYAKDMMESKGPIYENKKLYLVQRSQIQVPSEQLNVKAKEGSEPHKSHAPEKLNFGFGILDRTPNGTERFEEFGLRYSFHELEDPTEGHFFSELNMFDFKVRYYNEGAPRLRLHKARFVDLFSIAPMNSFEKKATWQFQLSFDDFLEQECFHCYGARIHGAYGLSFEPWKEHKPMVYALAGARLHAFDSEQDTIHLSPGVGMQLGFWTSGFFSRDSMQGEFSRYYLPLARRHEKDFLVSAASLRYSFDFINDTRLHLTYERKDIVNAFEMRLSLFF